MQPSRTRIAASWERCLRQHGLERHRIAFPQIVSERELKDVRAPIDDLIHLATPELDRLFTRLARYDYVVSLTDAAGVTVLFRCGDQLASECRAVGVLPGAVWTEESQGTNGIGTCIKEQRALSVVRGEHFGESLAGLSCTVAPIFGAAGRLAAVLNVTTPHADALSTQGLVRDIVRRSARRIENRYFERRNRGRPVLRISAQDDFTDLAAEVRVALDGGGRIVDATSDAARLLPGESGAPLGTRAAELHGVSTGHSDRGTDAVMTHQGRRFFVRRARADRESAASVVPAAAVAPPPGVPDIATLVGHDPVVIERVHLARRLLDRRLPILLQGETGTGKSALARALHNAGMHAGGPFVAINCAAIPAELIESELFGYRPGAFTGAARHGARGRILEADGGVLFLDEIGDMPMALQTRLLQVLSDGEVVPVGAAQPVRVSFAVVSASLHDIADLVRQGRFRQDLYFRLNGATALLPALRERADKGALIDAVFREEGAEAGMPNLALDRTALRLLVSHAWPGNIRELRHVARYAATLAEDGIVTPACLPPYFRPAEAGMRDERNITEAALTRAGWNVSRAARHLGISRATLHRRIASLDLSRPPPRGG